MEVQVYERRPDLRSTGAAGGRSINLAISDRGWKALAGAGLEEQIRKTGHTHAWQDDAQCEGGSPFQPYGQPGQFINSVSRGQLNIDLMNAAESAGVPFHFEQRVLRMDVEAGKATLENLTNQDRYELEADLIIGADGAYSMVRNSLI